jgi:hypothetical protein
MARQRSLLFPAVTNLTTPKPSDILALSKIWLMKKFRANQRQFLEPPELPLSNHPSVFPPSVES